MEGTGNGCLAQVGEACGSEDGSAEGRDDPEAEVVDLEHTLPGDPEVEVISHIASAGDVLDIGVADICPGTEPAVKLRLERPPGLVQLRRVHKRVLLTDMQLQRRGVVLEGRVC
eukprot:767897-Hanusia_phi.AAC.6